MTHKTDLGKSCNANLRFGSDIKLYTQNNLKKSNLESVRSVLIMNRPKLLRRCDLEGNSSQDILFRELSHGAFL